MKKKVAVPQSGRVGRVVNVITRWGQVERQFTEPRDPRTPEQQDIRSTLTHYNVRWNALTKKQRVAWCNAAADSYTFNRMGRRKPLSGYLYFVSLNSRRRNLGLDDINDPPVVPVFSENPVGELQITNVGGVITLRLQVASLPADRIVVQGARPRSPGIATVQHFPLLGFLPAPKDGWSDITQLYVARFGVPPVGKAVFIRTFWHINGWNDTPKQARAVVPAA